MSWTVIEMDGNGVRQTRKGGTLAGERPAETEPKPRPKMVTWRRCAHTSRTNVWFCSGRIPEGWIPLESQTSPFETVKQLPEGERP